VTVIPPQHWPNGQVPALVVGTALHSRTAGRTCQLTIEVPAEWGSYVDVGQRMTLRCFPDPVPQPAWRARG